MGGRPGMGGALHRGQEHGVLAGIWVTSPLPATVSSSGKWASSLADLTELLLS